MKGAKMHPGKRILAFLIDFQVNMFLGMFVVAGVFYLMQFIFHVPALLGFAVLSFEDLITINSLSSSLFAVGILVLWGILWPSVFMAGCNCFFGRTIGKRICGLRVVDFQGNNPDFRSALGRELLKMALLFMPFMWLLPLIQFLMDGKPFYDQIFHTAVKGKPKLSPTQKKYIQYYGPR